MRFLADLVYLLAGLLYLPIALYNALFLGKNRGGWCERFGSVPRFVPGRQRVWIHAVSLGEMNATSTLAAALRERLPEAEIVFSTTTDTGYARGVALYGTERVFRYPLDFSVVVSRALNRIQPSLIVLMELEVWPNLVRMATARGIPVAIANGRLTPRSARRLQRLGPIGRAMFRPLAWVGVQDEPTSSRFIEVGAIRERVDVIPSLKWDTAQVADRVEGSIQIAELLGLDLQKPIWVCGSTGPGEELALLKSFGMLLETDYRYSPVAECPVLVIAPRKPERFAEVGKLIESVGFVCVKRSDYRDAPRAVPRNAKDFVVLVDTVGELRKFYSMASVVFVGRSLVPMGGSDPMEVAALGKPILIGPHFENFLDPVRKLSSKRAVRIVRDVPELVVAFSALCDPVIRNDMGTNAQQVVRENQGGTRLTVDRLMLLLGPRTETKGSGLGTSSRPVV